MYTVFFCFFNGRYFNFTGGAHGTNNGSAPLSTQKPMRSMRSTRVWDQTQLNVQTKLIFF